MSKTFITQDLVVVDGNVMMPPNFLDMLKFMDGNVALKLNITYGSDVFVFNVADVQVERKQPALARTTPEAPVLARTAKNPPVSVSTTPEVPMSARTVKVAQVSVCPTKKAQVSVRTIPTAPVSVRTFPEAPVLARDTPAVPVSARTIPEAPVSARTFLEAPVLACTPPTIPKKRIAPVQVEAEEETISPPVVPKPKPAAVKKRCVNKDGTERKPNTSKGRKLSLEMLKKIAQTKSENLKRKAEGLPPLNNPKRRKETEPIVIISESDSEGEVDSESDSEGEVDSEVEDDLMELVNNNPEVGDDAEEQANVSESMIAAQLEEYCNNAKKGKLYLI